jgi:hypothetical protein
MGGYYASTTTSNGTVADVRDTNLIGLMPDGMKGYTIRIGTLVRLVDGLDVANGIIRLCPALPSVNSSAAGTTYEVFSVTPNEINNAIAQAVLKAGRDFVVPRWNVELTPDDEGNVVLPSDCVTVLMVENGPDWIPISRYEIHGERGQRTLVVLGNVGEVVRVQYLAAVGFDGSGAAMDVAHDVDARDVDAFIVEAACAVIHQARANMNPASDAARMHVTMMRTHEQAAELIRQRFAPARMSAKVVRAGVGAQR